MKKLVLILSVILALSSCKKEDYGQYHQEPVNTYNDPHDSTTYVYGGTLPSVGNATNDLVGTTWVLTKYVSAFASEYPNDTINFITVNTYTLNGGAVRSYQLNSIPSSTNFDLSLYYFFPFGGSHYSSNVGGTFVQDWEINNSQFNDIQNTTTTIKAWFTRIN